MFLRGISHDFPIINDSESEQSRVRQDPRDRVDEIERVGGGIPCESGVNPLTTGGARE